MGVVRGLVNVSGVVEWALGGASYLGSRRHHIRYLLLGISWTMGACAWGSGLLHVSARWMDESGCGGRLLRCSRCRRQLLRLQATPSLAGPQP